MQNLAGILNGALNIPKIDVSTENELVVALNNMQHNAAPNSVYFATVRTIDMPEGYTIPSMIYGMLGWKYSAGGTYDYGVQVFISYGVNAIYVRKYYATNAVWQKIPLSNV